MLCHLPLDPEKTILFLDNASLTRLKQKTLASSVLFEYAVNVKTLHPNVTVEKKFSSPLKLQICLWIPMLRNNHNQ
jgi:hypothetical protein